MERNCVDLQLNTLTRYGIKNLNKHLTLDLIRFAEGGISRADLARQMQLSRAAMTTIVNDMLEKQIVRETRSGESPSGRKPIMLEINPQRGFVIGVDMGATHLELVLADFSARVKAMRHVDFDVRQGPQHGLAEVDRQVRVLLEEAQVQLNDVHAASIGVPGPVVVEAGTVKSPPIMPGWDSYPIRAHLEELWGCPVVVNNDAELGALGEWAFGAGRGERHLAYIKVGSGIGAGLLLNGQIYGGSVGAAGEIGHVTLVENGPRCTCGNYGCLEALAGGKAIAERAITAVKAGQRTQLSSIQPIERITAKDVAVAARLGDRLAQQITADAGRYLGIALSSLVNLFNPGIVVVGGGVAQMGDLLLEPIRQAVEERSLQAAANSVRIVAAMLGSRSSSMGAVVRALDTALHCLTETEPPTTPRR